MHLSRIFRKIYINRNRGNSLSLPLEFSLSLSLCFSSFSLSFSPLLSPFSQSGDGKFPVARGSLSSPTRPLLHDLLSLSSLFLSLPLAFSLATKFRREERRKEKPPFLLFFPLSSALVSLSRVTSFDLFLSSILFLFRDSILSPNLSSFFPSLPRARVRA